MGRILTHTQRSWSGGEVSGSLRPRGDTARVATAVQTCRNGWPTRTGSWENRPGTRHAGLTKDQADHVRLERFFFNEAQAYALEMGAQYLRFYQFAETAPARIFVDGDLGDVAETQTLYLDDADDDLADLTGTLPSGGQTGYIEPFGSTPYKAFRVSPTSITEAVVTGAPGARSAAFSYTTASGNPGDADAWGVGTHTLTIEITALNNVSGVSFVPRLHRTNSSGVGQERVDASGFSLGDPTSGTVPGGGAATLGGFGVDVSSGGVGTYTFTWTDAEWAGPAADTDRLTLEFIFTYTHAGGGDGVRFEIKGTSTKLVTTVAAQPTPQAVSWTDAYEFIPGEVTFLSALSQFRRVYYLEDTAPDTDPTSVTDETDDDHGTLLTKDEERVSPFPSTTDDLNVALTADATEVQVFVTEAGDPGSWTWPTDDVTVSLAFGTLTGAIDVSVALVRFDEDNDQQEAGSFTSAQTLSSDTTFTFTAAPPSWTSPASTDRFGILVKYEETASSTADVDIETRSADSYVDIPAIEVGDDSMDYFYCVAAHSDKSPEFEQYHDDFWYPLPEDDDGRPILEVPTPFLAADLDDLEFQQSQDVIQITHEDHPPHELIRNAHATMSFGRWTLLPNRLKPLAVAPTGVYASDDGKAGNKTLRYQVTFQDDDTGVESVVGSHTLTRGSSVSPDDTNLTDAAQVTAASAASTDTDLTCTLTSHGLTTGDRIHIESVATDDVSRAHQNAKELLEGWVGPITKVDDDTFTLDGTAGQLTLGPISDTSSTTGYPVFTITYGLAYVEFVDFAVPKGDGDRRIELTWTPPTGSPKGKYLIYRTILGEEEWGLLGSTTELTFADEGDTEAIFTADPGTQIKAKAVADTASPPPDYSNPFRFENWPRASCFHAQRQWFGGTLSYPLRFWGSVTSDFANFSTRTPTTDDDAQDWTITDTEAHEIVRMVSSGGSLLLLTSGGVAEALGSGNGVFSAKVGPNLRTSSYVGAARVRPLLLDDALLYIHARQNRLWERRINIGEGGIGGYEGDDLTVYHPDLFDGYTISQLARAEVPQSQVFAVRSDGTLLGLTYLPRHEVAGWHRHDTALSGKFLSIATVPEQAQDVLWCVTERLVDGSLQYAVERMNVRSAGRANTDARLESYFFDAGVTIDGTNTTDITLTLTGGLSWAAGETGLTLTASEALFPGDGSNVGEGYRLVGADGEEAEAIVTADGSTTVQTVTLRTAAPASTQAMALTSWVAMVTEVALPHLEGATAGALADGTDLGTFTVSSGVITLDDPYGIIHAGLPIEADLITENIDRVNPGDSGIGLAKIVKRVTAFIHRTRREALRIGEHGIAASSLKSLPRERSDTVGDLVTDERTMELSGGYNRHGRLHLAVRAPLPVSVTALVTHYEEGGL